MKRLATGIALLAGAISCAGRTGSTPAAARHRAARGGPPAVSLAVLSRSKASPHAVSVTALRLTGRTLRQSPRLDLSGVDCTMPQGCVVAFSGDDLYVSRYQPAPGSAASSRLERYRPFKGPRALGVVELGGRTPTALWATGRRCFVGSVEAQAGSESSTLRVSMVDFSAAAPRSVELHSRSHDLRKAVDGFARLGPTLLAVDNVSEPMFVFVFDLPREGPPRYRFTADLGGGINRTVLHVGAAAGRLMVHTRYTKMAGSGQDLALFELAGRRLRRLAMVHEAARAKTTLSIIRSMGDPKRRVRYAPELLAGKSYTEWRGVATLAGRLVLGAGARGLLHLPLPRPESAKDDDDVVFVTKGRRHALDGECLDLASDGRRIYALTRQGTGRTLRVIRWAEGEARWVEERPFALAHGDRILAPPAPHR